MTKPISLDEPIARNLSVTIYKDNDVHSFLAREMSDVRWSVKFLPFPIDPEPIIESLTWQREDSNKFPNVLIFLNDKNDLISIDEFMGQSKNTKKK